MARIQRKHQPDKVMTEHNYRNIAFEPLMKDFEQRCAYSMLHLLHAGLRTGMHIDHFDPYLTETHRHQYNNLFPACCHCNIIKSDIWPDTEDKKHGLRFLNPCLEKDYGYQIFECPDCHQLIGNTAAARWHIKILALNAHGLIESRRIRSEKISNQKQMLKVFSEMMEELNASESSKAQYFQEKFSEIQLSLNKLLLYEIPPIEVLPEPLAAEHQQNCPNQSVVNTA